MNISIIINIPLYPKIGQDATKYTWSSRYHMFCRFKYFGCMIKQMIGFGFHVIIINNETDFRGLY